MVLDLRGNGGGVLEGAVQIVGMFVPKGSEVLSTKGKIKQWDRTYRTSTEPLDTVMPLARLINGGTVPPLRIVIGIFAGVWIVPCWWDNVRLVRGWCKLLETCLIMGK